VTVTQIQKELTQVKWQCGDGRARHCYCGRGILCKTSCECYDQQAPPVGTITFKHEPLILHIECRDLKSAENLLKVGE